jgi:3-oxoacyl-[acyl-carrier-protein] synthase II
VGDVVVTGYGVHTAFGPGAGALRRGVFTGTPAFAPTTRFDATPYRTPYVAESPGDPVLRDVLADCAGHALAVASLEADAEVAVLLGCAGDFTAITRFWRDGDTTAVADSNPAALADALADRFRLRGPRLAFTSACVASAHAIVHGWRLVAAGQVDAALCLGGYLVEEENVAKFDSGRALAKDGAVRPFSAERSGLLLGDGVAAVVLESDRSARRRGIRPLARLTGWGLSCDAHHVAKPHPDGTGLVSALRQALRRAGVRPDQVDYLNAHGTGTAANDRAETRGLHAVFGDVAPPVSSTKSTTGHLLEAAGAVEFVIALLALTDGIAPPTAGYRVADPDCDLDYVTDRSRPADLRRVVSVNAAFGGMNTALLLERP